MLLSTLNKVSLGSSLTGASLQSRSPSAVAGRGAVAVHALLETKLAKEARQRRGGGPKPSPEDIVAFTKGLPGISQPFPDMFDPLNFVNNAFGKADGINEVSRWRESEITHGRVAMLAALGFIVQEQILGAKAPRPFPHVQGPAINHFQQVEQQGAIFWEPLLFAIGLAEAYRISVGWENPRNGGLSLLYKDYSPGDLGFDPLGLFPEDPKEQYELQTKELNNGRLAMIGVAGFVAQELKFEKPIFANLNLAGTTGTPIGSSPPL